MKQIFVRLNRKIMDRRETVTNKKYSVVKFLIDNLYSEIPTSWLMHDGSKQLCLWPPRTANVASLIGNCISPNLETWDQYEVDVIKSCTSLESARRRAANSNYETTDEDSLGRGKRQHISNRYSSEEEEKEHNICRPYKKKSVSTSKMISAIPSCPDNLIYHTNKGTNVTNDDDSDGNNIPMSQRYCEGNKTHVTSDNTQSYDVHNIPIIWEGSSLCAPSSAEVQEDSNIKKYLKEILRMQATSNLMLQDVKQRVSRIEEVMRTRAPVLTKNIENSLITQILPLQTIESIRDFDSLLHDTDEAVIQFKDFLFKIGGINSRDNIHRTLSKIFTNECAINCSWKGIRNNFKVSDLYFIKIMRREITLQYSTFTEAGFDNIVAEWLRFAKQRKQREEKEKPDGHV